MTAPVSPRRGFRQGQRSHNRHANEFGDPPEKKREGGIDDRCPPTPVCRSPASKTDLPSNSRRESARSVPARISRPRPRTNRDEAEQVGGSVNGLGLTARGHTPPREAAGWGTLSQIPAMTKAPNLKLSTANSRLEQIEYRLGDGKPRSRTRFPIARRARRGVLTA